MKQLKRISFLALLTMFTFGFASNTYAWSDLNKLFESGKNHNGKKGGHGHGNSVGAPIDGGLLTVLGAAGVGYLLIRRKKRNNKEE